jgi:cbb3-type cytochrome oxidase maturation protein
MNILFLLIPLGLVLLAIAVGAFFWATRSGQFDDLDTPGWSVVMDDDKKPRPAGRTDRPDDDGGN